MPVPQHDFADIGIDGRERAARAGLAVFRCGMRVLHADCAMAGAVSGAPRFGCGAAAGSASWSAPRNVARGFVARAAPAAFGWTAVWRSGCMRRAGTRDLVGAAAGMACSIAGDDRDVALRVPANCDAAKLLSARLPGERSDALVPAAIWIPRCTPCYRSKNRSKPRGQIRLARGRFAS